MPYKLRPDKMYMMPTHFGPGMGPRQGPCGRKFECKDSPKSTSISVSFLTNREQLEEFLPERFEVGAEPVVSISASYMTEIEWLAGRGYNVLGVSFPAIFNGERDSAEGGLLTVLWENLCEVGAEPVVSVSASYMTEIEWLAGRGYNVLGVSFPAIFNGERDSAEGGLLTVLWENLCDPILTGREQLGFSKIYCELPEPVVLRGDTHCIASWLGFKFLDMKLTNMEQVTLDTNPAPAAKPPDDGVLRGTLHYKYMPRTGEWGQGDVGYTVLTPAEGSNSVTKELWRGEGTVEFHKARWEDLPTQYHIVNAFHELEIKEYRGATISKSVGGKDLSDQRILQ